ncbi:Protein-lysine n-methyltransferase [Thalictrum thalictroides]|uniref:Protein-lysine n-methyltransferase n=1 Tax=Thalictrum thalictroides TaxID=46969 RepID=A0A7J6W8F4_THATH|nr:Protein-lysine n-methyltransferase [Thalictrum thalictroides]
MEVEEGSESKKTIPHDDEEDEDIPMLSSQALEALKEFLNEQKEENPFEEEKSDSDEVALVTEDWRLSQFWYDQQTAETVAKEIQYLCASNSSCSVACIACPTIYAYLKV